MDRKYKVKGINDEHDTCECCGKTGLKRVVWLAPLDEDGQEICDPAPYGNVCAAYLLGITKERGGKSNARLTRALEAKLEETVNAYISNLRANWKQFKTTNGTMLVPADMDCTGKSGQEVYAERNTRFPVLGYLNGEMTLEQAAKLC